MNGEPEKADSFTQASLYLHLMMLVSESTCFLAIHLREKEICQQTIARVDAVMELYHIEKLNPNIAAGFYFQAAVYYALCDESEEAVRRLKQYVDTVCFLLNHGMIHGDSYFTKMDRWVEELDLGSQMPRSSILVIQSAKECLKHPAFDGLRDRKEFMRLIEKISKMEENISS